MHCKLEETGGTTGRARTTSTSFNPWAARYNTWLLIKLTPKGVVFSFLFFSTGINNTAWPASKVVGIQGASCCSCQDGLQVVCQLLHRDDVTGHLSGNIDQLALLSDQVGAEHCTPGQPAVYASTLAEGMRSVLSCREGAQAKGKTQGQRHTVSIYRIKAMQP
jgi:hypothetical protein